MSKQFDYSKYPRIAYIVEEHVYMWAKLGVAVGFGISFSINDSNETSGCESLYLSFFRLIEDVALRFHHVVREEETSRNTCRLIFMCTHINWSSSIVFNLSHYNSSDGRLRLSHFKMIR